MSLLHNTKRIFTMSIKSVFICYIAILHLILFIGFRFEKNYVCYDANKVIIFT